MHSEYPDNTNAEVASGEDQQRLPVSLHFITSVALIVGAVSLLVPLVEEYYRVIPRPGSIVSALNFWGVFYIIGAWGLLRRRRWAAVLVNALTIGWATIAITVVLLAYVGPMVFGSGFAPVGFPSFLLTSLTFLTVCYAWWQNRVLQRPDFLAVFERAEGSHSHSSRYRFSLLQLMLCVTISALVTFRLTNERFQYSQGIGGSSWNVDGESVNLNYRSRHGRFGNPDKLLDYLIFTRDLHGYGTSSRWSFLGFLDLQSDFYNDTVIDLPTENQLMEIVDGQLRRSDARITYDELQAFLADPDAERSLDGLLEFVEELRSAAP